MAETVVMDDSTRMRKLTMDNFFEWSIDVKASLMLRDAYEAIEGYEDDEANPPNAAETRRRMKINQIAMCFIFKSVSSIFLSDVGDLTNAKEAYAKLEELTSSFGLYNTVHMFKDLLNQKFTEGTSMLQYINNVQMLEKKIKKAGFVFHDKTIACTILAGLPMSKYESLVRSLDRSMDDENSDLNVATVKSKLLIEEQRLKKFNDGDEESANKISAMKILKKPQGKRGKNANKSSERRVICFACNEKGHFSSNCPRFENEKGEEKGKNATYDRKETKQGQVVTACPTEKQYRILCTTKEGEARSEGTWLFDSGASDHMTFRKDLFEDFRVMEDQAYVADGISVKVEGIGSVTLHMAENCGGYILKFTNVLYVPSLKDNLLSLGTLEEKGFTIKGGHGQLAVMDKDETLFTAHRIGRIYHVFTEGSSVQNVYQGEKCARVTFRNWHERLGHVHGEALKKMPLLEKVSTGKQEVKDCEICIQGKFKRNKFPSHEHQTAKEPLERIHSDVVGPITPPSYGHAKYFVTFLDENTYYLSVIPLQKKSEVFNTFCQFKKKVEVFHRADIQELQTDNGGEYCGTDFEEYLKACNINHRKSVPHTPQQNGRAERQNYTLLDMMRCMLTQSGVPKGFWAETLATACMIRNLCPSTAMKNQIPFELWYRRKLEEKDINFLRVFGCLTWSLVIGGPKLNPRAEKCILLGYPEDVKGFRLWSLERQKIIVSRDVKFQEDVFPFKSEVPQNDLPAQEELIVILGPGEVDDQDQELNREDPREEDAQQQAVPGVDNNDLNQPEIIQIEEIEQPRDAQDEQENRRTIVPRKPCPCCNSIVLEESPCNHANMDEDLEPSSLEKAVNSKHAEFWRRAMKEEIDNMKRNQVWEIVEKPEGAKIVGAKWVYRLKRDSDGRIVRFRARLVARGFNLVSGIDYFSNTDSPVVRRHSLRILVALACEKSWEVEEVDVVAAYLNSPLSDEVYMQQPPGYDMVNVSDSSCQLVCKLKKSVYGLPQSSKEWNKCLNLILLNLGFQRCVSDPCVYVSSTLILAVHVENIAVFGSKDKIQKFKVALSDRLEVKDLGPAVMLSLHISRPCDDVKAVDQIHYIDYILKEFDMSECSVAKSPLSVRS